MSKSLLNVLYILPFWMISLFHCLLVILEICGKNSEWSEISPKIKKNHCQKKKNKTVKEKLGKRYKYGEVIKFQKKMTPGSPIKLRTWG